MSDSFCANNDRSLEEEFRYYAEAFAWATVFNELVRLAAQKGETVSEWVAALEGVALALLVKGDIYKFLTTVFGMTAEEVGKTLTTNIRNFNAKKTAETFAVVYKQLEDTGTAAHRVAPKILYPILEGISLEEDEYLKEKWTKLLTSSIAKGEIHPSYIILENLAEQLKIKEITEKIREHLELTPEEIKKRENSLLLIRESIDNLKRLNLVRAGLHRQLGLATLTARDSGDLVRVREDNTSLGLSDLGVRFLKAAS
jgi:Glu-tRNA(Gln) amidotransferase subunit E-like FAD-binding protein